MGAWRQVERFERMYLGYKLTVQRSDDGWWRWSAGSLDRGENRNFQRAQGAAEKAVDRYPAPAGGKEKT